MYKMIKFIFFYYIRFFKYLIVPITVLANVYSLCIPTYIYFFISACVTAVVTGAVAWRQRSGSGSLAAAAMAAWRRQLGGDSLAATAAARQQLQQWRWQHCNSVAAVAATLAAWQQRGGGSLVAAAVTRQWWQWRWWQHCKSATVVAAVMAALRWQLGSGAGAAAWCWLRQRGSSGSGGISSSVTVPQWWQGVGSLFDFCISLLVASLGGIGCRLKCGWYFGSPFISPWLTK